MRLYGSVLILTLFLAGCASFKELEPKPELSPLERGYIELKDGKDNFELDQDKKYFIKFPPPFRDRYYLVLVTEEKPFLHSYLTNTFDDGKEPIIPILDEAPSSDSVLVYAVDTKSRGFYWVIDGVRNDLILTMHYRYVPQWRYTFENKYAQFKDVLADNTVDRSTYNSIDANFNVDRIDFGREIPHVDSRMKNLKSMKEELLRLESVFPPDIAASRDTAYEKYVALKSNVDEELKFQDDYSTALAMFKKEIGSRGNTGRFLEDIPYFTDIMSRRGRFPTSVTAKASQVFLKRLSEVASYLEGNLHDKADVRKISPDPSLDGIEGLYRACGQQIPAGTEAIIKFINRFNIEVDGLQKSLAGFESLKGYFNSHIGSPTESFYSDLVTKVGEIKATIPQSEASRFERYGNYSCAVMLNREIANAGNRADDFAALYQTGGTVARNISDHAWSAAEMGLRDLNETRGYSESPEILTQRNTLVKQFESQVFNAVKNASQQRIDAFIKAHEMAIDDVPALYADSA
ncbi:MAG: hypothetical protein HW412_634, partial [Bacteroidetes bacterium]|nr:hypothetical protein [Bacteroidota bacterium]